MKRILFLIILLAVCATLFSSCAPTERFSREDWEVCGADPVKTFKMYSIEGGRFDFSLINMSLIWDSKNYEPGKALIDTDIPGGRVSLSCEWYTGQQDYRLLTCQKFSLQVTGKETYIKLPRGLGLGCTLKDAERAFGLEKADEAGIYYGDGLSAPYALIEDSGNGTKTLTLAAPARETDSAGFSYPCKFIITADDSDRVTGFTYISDRRYSILPGLPEPGQVDEVRIYEPGKAEPERVMKFEEAIDLLAWIQNAWPYKREEAESEKVMKFGEATDLSASMQSSAPSGRETEPTPRIEIVSGSDIYTLKFEGELIEAPDGSVYRMWVPDAEEMYKSVPELLAFSSIYLHHVQGNYNEGLSKEQVAVVNEILPKGLTACDRPLPAGLKMSMSAGTGCMSYRYEYYYETNYIVYIYYDIHGEQQKKLFTVSDEDAEKLSKVYEDELVYKHQ